MTAPVVNVAPPSGSPLGHVAGTNWGTRRYLDMNRLVEASEAA
jgi:hypothetical protein